MAQKACGEIPPLRKDESGTIIPRPAEKGEMASDGVRGLQRKYARTSRFYDLLDLPFEHLRYRSLRPQVFQHARGNILDLGAGTGRNMAHYPPSSGGTLAVDLSPGMLRRARRRNTRENPLALMDASRLALRPGTFDTVVATFLFCVLPDPLHPPVLREIARVLRPGGRLILLEYHFSKHRARQFMMRLMAPWVEGLYGARFDRQTVRHLMEAGWKMETDRFVSGDVVRLIVAQRPPSPA